MKQKNKESSDVMKIAAYCRVSTEKEAQKFSSYSKIRLKRILKMNENFL